MTHTILRILSLSLILRSCTTETSGDYYPATYTATEETALPTYDSSDLIIRHTGLTLSYNTSANTPKWVAWELTRYEAETKTAERSDRFRPDPILPERNQVTTNDYTNSGYDRGHMCPSADMRWSMESMDDCFLLSNICPQAPKLNQQWWEHTEEACRRWAEKYGSVLICCGPIYDSKTKHEYIGSAHLIAVPDGFYKSVVEPNTEMGIGFLYTNDETRQTMEDAAVTIDEIERVTGYDLFHLLPDDIEEKVEAQCNLRDWQ